MSAIDSHIIRTWAGKAASVVCHMCAQHTGKEVGDSPPHRSCQPPLFLYAEHTCGNNADQLRPTFAAHSKLSIKESRACVMHQFYCKLTQSPCASRTRAVHRYLLLPCMRLLMCPAHVSRSLLILSPARMRCSCTVKTDKGVS